MAILISLLKITDSVMHPQVGCAPLTWEFAFTTEFSSIVNVEITRQFPYKGTCLKFANSTFLSSLVKKKTFLVRTKDQTPDTDSKNKAFCICNLR